MEGISPQAMAGLRKALEISKGKRPNEVNFRKSAQEKIISLPELGERTEELISTGKLVADPANVKNAKYNTKAASKLILFHYDFVALHVGKIINFVGEYQASRINPDEFPLYRLAFDRPIFNSGNTGSNMERTILATRDNQVAKVFVEMFIEQATMTNRFTRQQREEYERRTGKKLKDQFWCVRRWELSLPDYNKFHLFLPSGLDYSLVPWVRPDGVIDIKQSPPEDTVIVMGYKTLTDGHAVSMM